LNLNNLNNKFSQSLPNVDYWGGKIE